MSGQVNEETLKSALSRRSFLRMPGQVSLDPVDIVAVAQEVLGAAPVNGKTGRLQKKLHEIYQGRPATIDSSRTTVRISSWNDEAEKIRLETLFRYGLCEAFNYNATLIGDQLATQAVSIQNLEESYKNKAILPEIRTELSLLTLDKLEVEKPGFPGEIIDMRAIAATVHLTASSTSDRWRQMAREILDIVLPKEIQCVYSAATKASMYFPLPPAFLDSIVQCCAISSGLDEVGMASYLPSISSHVRTSLQFKLNEIKKGKSKDIDELVRIAVAVGWTPPGVTRQEACEMYADGGYLGFNPNELLEEATKSEMDVANDGGTAMEGRPTPTSHLKRRGPLTFLRRNDRKKERNGQSTPYESPIMNMSCAYLNPGAPAQPDHPSSSRDNWWKEEEEEEEVE